MHIKSRLFTHKSFTKKTSRLAHDAATTHACALDGAAAARTLPAPRAGPHAYRARSRSQPPVVDAPPAISQHKVSLLFDAMLAEWIESCARLRLALTGHNIRTKAQKL
ncbi:hypothetical protein PybrP1_003913, partial [[Pythium] brassicae (nom. inval.)]